MTLSDLQSRALFRTIFRTTVQQSISTARRAVPSRCSFLMLTFEMFYSLPYPPAEVKDLYKLQQVIRFRPRTYYSKRIWKILLYFVRVACDQT